MWTAAQVVTLIGAVTALVTAAGAVIALLRHTGPPDHGGTTSQG